MAPAERAGVKLSLVLGSRLPHIVADALSLRQILLNLLTNALKFTRPGGSVKVVTCCAPGGPITIEVRDTGSGRTTTEIARSLDASNPPTPGRREKGGLGLGLPLVRSLAEANGARLSIESTPGKGTSATITFARNRAIPV
jgi:signal transduction histidine kinase